MLYDKDTSQRFFSVGLTALLFFLAFSGAIHAQVQKPLSPVKSQISAPQTAISKIERAYNRGQISLDEWALYTASALFEPEQLPTDFQGEVNIPFGTPLRIRFFQIWSQLSESTRQRLYQYGFQSNGALARPTGLDSVRTTAYFKIHYSVKADDVNAVDTADANNNGTPDYIELIMRLLQEVYAQQLDSMQYAVPPPDSVEDGKAFYDVYVYKLSDDTYGYVQPEKVVGDNPNSSGRTEKNAAMSYMGLRNNYVGFTGSAERNLKVTIAHEFYHAIQTGYDVYEKTWLMEATATWIEDEIYDDINDNYQYLPSWFRTPRIALDATADEAHPDRQHWYGSWIFFRYLSEHIGGQTVVRKIWEHSVSHNSKTGDFSFNAISDALNDYQKSFSKVFLDFQVANALKTLSPYDYEEASAYPEIGSIQVVEAVYQDSTKNMRASADFYKVYPPYVWNSGDEVEVKVDGLDSLANFIVQVVTVRGTTANVTRFNPRTNSTHLIQDLDGVDLFYIVVVNMNTKGKWNNYNIQIKRKIQFTRFMPGYYLSKNPFFLVSSVADTLRLLNQYGLTTFSNVSYFRQSPTHDLIAYEDRNDTIRVIYNTKFVEIIPDSGLTVPEIGWSNAIFSIDTTTVWLAGPGVYRAFPLNDSFFWLSSLGISGFGSLSYSHDLERLVADDGVAIWVDVYWSDAGGGNTLYHVDFWRAFGTTAERILQFQNDIGLIIGDWAFRDSVLVYTDYSSGNERADLVYHDFKANSTEVIAQPSAATLITTNQRKIAWSEGLSVYLWENGQTRTIYEAESLGEACWWLDMDSSGIAWLRILTPDGRTLIPRFFFYDFKEQNIYSATLSNMNLYDYPRMSNPSKRMQLRDGKIYFTAMDINESVQWPYVYSIDMRRQTPTGISSQNNKQPKAFELEPNYPNPFRDQTSFRIYLPKTSSVEVHVYDILGRLIYSQTHEKLPAGEHRISLKTRNWASGMYFYRVKVGPTTRVGKMLIVR
jgi:hypothetical protein